MVTERTNNTDWYENTLSQFRRRKRIRKPTWLVGALVLLVACGAITAFYANRLFYGVKSELVSLDFGDGYTIRVWVKEEGLFEPGFDPDHVPAVFYEVTRYGNVVKPVGFLTASSEPFSVSTAFADEGELIGVGIYVVECQTGNGVLIILEHLDDDRWFIGTASDVDRQRWINRYERLKQENPDLPSCL